MTNSANNHPPADVADERRRMEVLSAAVHTPAQERRYIIALIVVMAVLACLYPALKATSYKGSADSHAAIEMAGALAGLVAGFALVMRFYALGSRFHLLIGLAFFVNGAEDLVHGLLSFEIAHGFSGAPASSLEQFIPGTYATGRLMLGLLLLAAPFVKLWSRESESPKQETLWISGAAIVLTIIATGVAFILPLPQFIYPGRLISRPVDLVSAVVLLLALVVFFREYHRSRDMLLWWILLSIGINLVGQTLMSFSKELYDAFFDVSHVCKVLGYVAPLLGFSLYQVAVIADSERPAKALRKSEQRLQTVLDNSTAFIFMKDLQGRYIVANRRFETAFNMTKEQVIGKTDYDLFTRQAADTIRANDRKVIEAGTVLELEEAIPHRDGVEHTYITIKSPLYDPTGKPYALCGIATDITARKQAELALIERMKELNCRYAISRLDGAEAPLSTILQKTAEIIPPGWQYPEITCARIAFEDQEFKSAKFETAPWRQTSDIDVHDRCVGSVEVYYLEERPEIDEGPFLKGERDLIDDIARYLSSVIERKQAEAALRESEERYRELFEYAHDLIFTVDASTGLVTTMNAAARDVLSYEPDDLTNEPYSAFVSPADLDAVGRHIEAAIGDTSETVEAWCMRKDGSPVLLDLRMRSIPVPGREAVLHVIAYDVTQRHHESEAAKRLGEILQQRVQTKTAGLEEANRHLRQTQSKLIQAERLAAVGQLAAGVAHEINNPLSFVANNLAVLRRDCRSIVDAHQLCNRIITEQDPDQRKRLAQQAQAKAEEMNLEYAVSSLERVFDQTAHGTERIRKIVADMCDFTRLGEAEWKETNVNDALDTTITILLHEIKSKNIQLEKNYQDVPYIYCMPGRLNQVFLNILINAIEAAPENGRIAVSTQPYEKGVKTAITDNGPGIPAENLCKIFDPFFTTKSKGSGLGLSISLSVIADLNGRIEVESEQGAGATFTILLPATEAPAVGSRAAPAASSGR
ncbi:MAG: PAS domain S-box protein [Planctomycetes bacterium]|nr:PAS domain S-box protein [Planctomycetota bacterium]